MSHRFYSAHDFFSRTVEPYSGLFKGARSGSALSFRTRLTIVSSLAAGQGGRFLDCAVGSGEIAHAVLQVGNFSSAHLVDFAQPMLCRAREVVVGIKDCEITFVESDCFRFLNTLDGSKFDLIICLGLIAHSGNLNDLLQGISEALAPGGQAIFQSTIADHLGIALHRRITANRYRIRHGYNIHYHALKELKAAIESAGLEIVQLRRYCLFLPFLDKIFPFVNWLIERIFTGLASQVGSEALFLLKKAKT